MFLCIDDNHGMPNCCSKLGRVGALDCHISNQIGDTTHLHLLLTSSDSRDVATLWNLVDLRVKVFQSFESRRCFNSTCVVRYDQYCVTVEVRTRKMLGNTCMNADRILCISKDATCFRTTVINSELRDLKCPTMGVPNENNTLTISETRCID